jgi:cysteine desulfurase
VVRVTGNYTSESPLHPAAREALLAAFDQGWADPKKLSQNSSRAAILRNQALENIASSLAIKPDEIEVLGEPNLGHYLAIAGLLSDETPLIYSSIDKGKIRAIARSRNNLATELSCDSQGQIQWFNSNILHGVISLQLANGESGVIQDIDAIPENESLIAVDATISGPRIALPDRWDTALFDSKSWAGPAGLAILAIRNSAAFRYPLPRIAPIRTPGSFSLPLLIASSVALENFHMENMSLREYAISQFSNLPGCQIIAPSASALPHIFSILVEGVPAEFLVKELSKMRIDVDSGSACSPEDLQPSHVLAAMGYPTNGHLRITLHAGTNQEEIDVLVAKVSEVSEKLRS